jgi:hypothetical protein
MILYLSLLEGVKRANMVDIVIPSHMKFAGMMAGGKSYHNIDVDVLKSAIQKYVRRGMFDDAIRCVYELDLF